MRYLEFLVTILSIRLSGRIKNTNSIKKSILINAIRPHLYSIFVEIYLAAIIARRKSNKVFILYDFGILNHWDSTHLIDKKHFTYKDGPIKVRLFGHAIKLYIKILSFIAGITVVQVRDLDISKINLNKNEINHVNSSVLRYSSEGENIKIKKYTEISTLNAKILKANILNLYEKYKFTNLISSHGVYVSWGVIHDYCREQGAVVRVVTPFIYKTGNAWVTENALQKYFNEYNLRDKSKSKITDCDVLKNLSDRVQFNAPDLRIYFNEDKSIIKIDKSKYKNIYSIFPNVIWDGAIVEKNTIFNSMSDWVLQTIKYFIDNKNNLLVIKLHPAESSLMKFSEGLLSIILNNYPNIKEYKNIMIIESHNNIDVYKFIAEYVDVPLVYDGNIAVEAAYLEKPILNFSKSRYSNAGFTYNVNSIFEYFDILSKPEKLACWRIINSNQIRKNLINFCKKYYFDDVYYVPIYNESYWTYNSYILRNDWDELINHNTCRLIDATTK